MGLKSTYTQVTMSWVSSYSLPTIVLQGSDRNGVGVEVGGAPDVGRSFGWIAPEFGSSSF